jgi:hypothetical protein
MDDRKRAKRESLSVKDIAIVAGVVGVVSIGLLALQHTDAFRLRPASGTAAAMAAASDHKNAP